VKSIQLIYILFLCFSSAGLAQQITVKDAKGHPLPNAVVALQSLSTNKLVFNVTDASGQVNLENTDMPATISVSHVSFETYSDTLRKEQNSLTLNLISKDVRLDEVIVTSQYLPRSSDQIVNATTIISREKIESRASNSLDELLEQEAGMRVSQDQVLGSSMTMNGMSGQNIKFLLDGVPIIGRLDGDIDISQLLLSNVERIEIINGPMSAMYGTDAAGGIVNIISKPSVNAGYSGNINMYHETSGHYNLDGGAGFQIGSSNFQVNAGRNFFQGWSLVDSSRNDQWKPKEQLFGSLNYKYIKNKYTVGFQSNIMHETVTNKGPSRITPYYAYAFDEYYKTIRFSNKLTGTYMVTPFSGVDVSVARSDYKRIKNTWRKDMVSLEESLIPNDDMHDTTLFHAWNIRSKFGKQDENAILNYQVGFDFNIETAKGSRFVNSSENISDYAIFSTLEYKASHKFVIKPSIRIAYNSNYKAPVIPSLAFLYQLSDPVQVRLSYGRGFRAPGIKELYLYFVDINHNIQGNDQLLPEYSDNFYLATSHTHVNENIKLTNEVGLYHNSIRNMITLAQPDLSSSLFTYINIGNFSSHGINFRSDLKYRNYNFGVGFSYTGRSNIYADSGNFKSYIYNPDLSINSGYHIQKLKLSVNVFYKFNGKIPGYGISSDNSIYQFYNDSYSLMDAVVRKSLFNGVLDLGAGIKNLFDVTNIRSVTEGSAHSSSNNYQAIGTGRSFFVNLKIKLLSR
jgi:outer membrane receptor for ferrienterochelin and colicins